MENLFIEETDYTPTVKLDFQNNTLGFKGKCYPNNAFEFFNPIINWIKEYIAKSENIETIININLAYVNSSTSQILFEIFDIFDENKKHITTINFYINNEDDEDEEDELFEDYYEEFPDLNIRAIKE